MYSKQLQEVIFVDVNEHGEITYNWQGFKEKTLMLSDSYNRLGDKKKAKRCAECGTYIEFRYYPSVKKRKLHGANFCKLRLCPMCNKRRSKKVYAQSYKVMKVASQKYEFIFLTLTQKNVSADELKDELDRILYGFKLFAKRKEFKQAVKGWFRGLEITHDTNKTITKDMMKKKKDYYKKLGLKVGDVNPNYDMYHPHIHIILAVNPSYFKSRDYIKQDRYREMWQECIELDYLPQVNVQRFKTSDDKELSKSLAETSKYTVKDSDILTDDFVMTDKTVATLDKALAYRRLVAWGGVLKEIHKQLNLDDAETGDLVNSDSDEDDLTGLEYYIECVGWVFGLNNYYYKNIRLPEEDNHNERNESDK